MRMWIGKYILILSLSLSILLDFPSELAWSSLAVQSSKKAQSYEGIRERKSNSSPQIDKFIKRGGGRVGWAWCMYFVYYCVDETCKSYQIDNPLKRTGSVAAQYNHCNQAFDSRIEVIYPFQSFAKFKIHNGDILIFKYNGKYIPNSLKGLWRGHTGFGLSEYANNLINTIEGNTNKAGSREGDGVYRKVRKIKSNNKLRLVAILRLHVSIDNITKKLLVY